MREMSVKRSFNLKNIRYKVEYLLFLSFSFIIPLFPRRIMLSAASILGNIGYRLLSKRKKIALINLDIAFGNAKNIEEKREIVKESFRNFVRGVVDILYLKDMTRDQIAKILEIDPEDLKLLRKIHRGNKGILFAASHFGNWEIMAIAYGYWGPSSLNVVARRFDNPYINMAMNKYRQKSGNNIIYKDNASKKIIRALKRNEGVAILMDQNTGNGGIFVDFFGKPAATTKGMGSIHLLTKSPIIMATCYPLEDYRYRIVFGPEVKYKESSDKEKDIHEITQKCTYFIEEYIRKNPDYWLWGHKRWNKQPYGEKKTYNC